MASAASTQSITKVKTLTLTGNVTSIDSANNTFLVKKSSGFWASISALLQFWKPKTQTYCSVAVTTDTQMTKKVAGQGTVPATFSDLAITQKVLVRGQLSSTTTQTYQTINAKKVFILTPPSKQEIITPTSTPTSTADICSTKCLVQQYKKGICRSWNVTLNAQMGCKNKEVDIGQTGDCTTTVGGHLGDGSITVRPLVLVGVGKTCCCSNAATSTEPIENGKCMWCGQECVKDNPKDNPKFICPQIAPHAGYTCEWYNGQCYKVSNIVGH